MYTHDVNKRCLDFRQDLFNVYSRRQQALFRFQAGSI